ncbi:MAG: helix-turn-helix domain-containing protein [Blastomonas fulva]|nr:helix-turn-helix transcriptional regulator [Blastomonas sp. AAP25]
MSAPPPTKVTPAIEPARLNAKELEILRLLAEGHTVKSIATGLNRSEASINERLREARRKTGVGSSRELARLLDAQKIWDRKIDLSSHSHSTDSPDRPPHRHGPWSKGKMMMLIALPLVAAGLLMTSLGLLEDVGVPDSEAVMPAGASPLIGAWSLDVAQIPAAERPRAVTIAFREAAEGNWNTRVDIVAPDGSRMTAESTARLDGLAVPVTGNMGFIDSISLRQPEPTTLVMTLAKDGKRVSTRVYTSAKDGRTMTETIVWAAEGTPDIVRTTFNRTS